VTLSLLSPLIIIACALLFIGLERRFPYDQTQSLFRAGFWNDLGMYTIVQSYLLSYLIFGLIGWIDDATSLSRLRIISDWPIFWQTVLSLVTHDLYIYWFHRLQHRSERLWRVHEAHHSTEDVDWLSGSRSHSLEILINQTIEFAPLVLLGCAPETILIKGTIDAVWGMWIHSNIDVRTGRLQYLLNGPEMHRWHHAVDSDAHNKNFGTKLAIWDWIFGTAFLPANRKPAGYGLGEDYPSSWWRQHVWAFRRREEILSPLPPKGIGRGSG
jgi:sterol desaturase/sphingolipid hydroxylase (fatty acid hydroxylase superfamily)